MNIYNYTFKKYYDVVYTQIYNLVKNMCLCGTSRIKFLKSPSKNEFQRNKYILLQIYINYLYKFQIKNFINMYKKKYVTSYFIFFFFYQVLKFRWLRSLQSVRLVGFGRLVRSVKNTCMYGKVFVQYELRWSPTSNNQQQQTFLTFNHVA